jgi:cysteinyl-tRNA synthetase
MKSLEESARTLNDWYRFAADVEPSKPAASVVEALLDDLNTPQAIAALHGLRNSSDPAGLSASLRQLGFLSESAAQWESRKRQASGVDAGEIDRLIAERTAARARKDFKESDRIRDELAAKGVVIKDGKDSDGKPVTTWELA